MNEIVLGERTEETVRVYFEKAKQPEIKAMLPQKAQTVEEALEDYKETLLPSATSFGRTIILMENTWVMYGATALARKILRMQCSAIVCLKRGFGTPELQRRALLYFLICSVKSLHLKRLGPLHMQIISHHRKCLKRTAFLSKRVL